MEFPQILFKTFDQPLLFQEYLFFLFSSISFVLMLRKMHTGESEKEE